MREEEAARALGEALRRVRWSVVALLVLCAGVIAAQAAGGGVLPAPALERSLLALALGLAIGSIFTRQLAAVLRVAPRTRLRLLLASYLLAGGIGLVGVASARLEGDRGRALLYVCAGAIFALRSASLPPGARRAGTPQ